MRVWLRLRRKKMSRSVLLLLACYVAIGSIAFFYSAVLGYVFGYGLFRIIVVALLAVFLLRFWD